jgi:hypothetical protein
MVRIVYEGIHETRHRSKKSYVNGAVTGSKYPTAGSSGRTGKSQDYLQRLRVLHIDEPKKISDYVKFLT